LTKTVLPVEARSVAYTVYFVPRFTRAS